MNQVFRLMALVAVVFYSNISPAQDVYNFYFNKNTKPGAVNLQPDPNAANPVVNTPAQTPATVAPVPPLAPVNTQAPITQPKVAKDDFKKWEVGVGTYSSSSWGKSTNVFGDRYHHAEGLGLVGAKRLNKYFSLDATVANLEDSDLNIDYLYFAAGIVITPLRINLFGHDLIELGLQLGLQTNQDVSVTEDINSFEIESTRETLTVNPYLGIKLGVNMTKELALVVESKSSSRDDVEFHSGSLSLRYRF